MAIKKQWIQAATVAVDEETGALLTQPGGLSNADRVEKKVPLPNSGAATIELGKVCHTLILSLPSGASCTYSFKGTADADSPDLDDTMLMREKSPEGTNKVYVFTSSDMSGHKISIRGW